MKLLTAAYLTTACFHKAEALVGIGGQLGSGPGLIRNDAREANQHPNATKSVSFSLGSSQGWTWRVNVTDVSVSNGSLSGGSDVSGPDPTVVNTVFDFQWPNKTANLNETIDAMQDNPDHIPLCLTFLNTPVWPNVTNKLTADQDGSCTPAFGERCTNAIRQGFRPGGAGRCPGAPYFGQLDECQDVFGGLSKIPGVGTGTFTFDVSGPRSNRTMNGYTVLPTMSGDGVAFMATEAYLSPNATALAQAESMLQMIYLWGSEVEELLCMRVDPTIDDSRVSYLARFADNATGTSDEGSTGTGSADSETSSSAASARMVAAPGSFGLMGLLALMSWL